MAPSAPHATGSRAIKIPLHPNQQLKTHAGQASRRRNGPNTSTNILRADSIERGQASSVASETWTASPPSFEDPTSKLTNHYLQRAAAPSCNGHPASASAISTDRRKDKQPAASNDFGLPTKMSPPGRFLRSSPLGPDMLSSTAYKSVNLSSPFDSDSEQLPRLITYTKHSQGFTWNDELFLPSYMMHRSRWGGRHSGGSRRSGEMDVDHDSGDSMGDFNEDWDRCPVTDIFVTDEEAAALMP